MARTKQGIVTYVNEKDWQDTTLYSFKLRDDDTYYGCGEDKPDIETDDEVEFEYTQKGNRTNVDVDSIDVLGQAEPTKKKARSGGGGKPRSGGGKPAGNGMSKDDWDLKDNRIRYAGTLNTAVEITKLLASQDKLPVKKGSKAETYTDLVTAFILRLADDLWISIGDAPERLKGATVSFKDLEQPEDLEPEADEDEAPKRRRRRTRKPDPVENDIDENDDDEWDD